MYNYSHHVIAGPERLHQMFTFLIVTLNLSSKPVESTKLYLVMGVAVHEQAY